MKRVQGQPTENTFEAFGFETLSNEEMNALRGGAESRPRTRDKDVWPDEDE
jgi:hypothetical protein